MNYLFFDVECAKCTKNGEASICEFGYVVVTESFGVIKKDHFLINPDSGYDWYALKNILHYTKKEYNSQPKFDFFYDRIREALTLPDTAIVGHTTGLDYKYIASECKRYNKPLIPYNYYDVSECYQILEDEHQYFGLEKMVEKLGITLSGHLHTAIDDAIATMLSARELCLRHDKTMEELLSIQLPKKVKPPKKPYYYKRKKKKTATV